MKNLFVMAVGLIMGMTTPCFAQQDTLSAPIREKHSIARFLDLRPQSPDTVRAPLSTFYDLDKLVFMLREGDTFLKVQLDGKKKDMMPAISAMDLRQGDTLTVVGVMNSRKKLRKLDPQMVSAQILSIDYRSDHDDQAAYLFSLDKEPSFMGHGYNTFSSWVSKQLVYPPISRSAGSEGTVRIRFTIDKNGELVNPRVWESSGDRRLDAEAIRVVSSSPQWEPGMLNGKPVRVELTLPIIFQLKTPVPKK